MEKAQSYFIIKKSLKIVDYNETDEKRKSFQQKKTHQNDAARTFVVETHQDKNEIFFNDFLSNFFFIFLSALCILFIISLISVGVASK